MTSSRIKQCQGTDLAPLPVALHKIWLIPSFSLLRAAKIIAKAKVTEQGQDGRKIMAENETRAAGRQAMDYAEHEKTYQMFLRLIQYTAAGVAIILGLLASFWG